MPARFVPPYISDGASSAEHKVFELLHESEPDCVVFHSVGLASHLSKVYGEIDFVIISKYGVLCLEVKGGAVEMSDGIWKYYNRYGDLSTKAEGPFKQATSGMFSLRDCIRNNSKANFKIANTLFACGVAFPDTVFNKKGLDIIPEIILDQRNISDINKYIKEVYGYWGQKYREKTGYEAQQLSEADISLLSSIIRNDFKTVPGFKSIIDEVDSKIIKLTEEQVAAFEALSENERIIVTGSAGTGKTILGLEYAKKISCEGKKVLFLTYNKMLAEYLRNKTEASAVDICHFHGFISRFLEVKNQGTSDYFQTELPDQFLEFLETEEAERYDVVIIDEGQDLLRENYLCCIDSILKDGLEDGRWCVLLDPNQNIYDNNNEFKSCLDMIKKYTHTQYNLTTNCRNTMQIGSVNYALHDKYKHPKYMRVEGENVTISTYNSTNELEDLLKRIVKDLIRKDIDLSDVIILSPHKYENTSLKGKRIFDTICCFQNVSELDFVSPVKNTLRYSTVHSFKGLEAKIILLFDFSLSDDKHEMLSYIAISRANTQLYFLIDAKYKNIIMGRLEKAEALNAVQLEA